MSVAHVTASIGAERYKVDIQVGRHALVADEPEKLGGADAGASPFGLFLSSLAACTVMTLKMYAERKEWSLGKVGVDLRIIREGDVMQIERLVSLEGVLDSEQRARLAEIVEKTPVTLAIKQGMSINTRFEN